MKRFIFTVILIIALSAGLAAQTYTAVDIDDPVYEFIDTMIIKGVVRRDVMAKPWPRTKVLSILEEISSHPTQLTVGEKEYLNLLVNRLDRSIPRRIREQGAVDVSSDFFPAEIGLQWDSEFRLGLSDQIAYSYLTFFNFYVQGDTPAPVSYRAQVRAGLYDVDFDSYTPYTYTRQWDGDPFNLAGDIQYGFPTSASGGLEIEGEFATSLWEDKLWLQFGRYRRDWGTFGHGNLYFSGEARPFTALQLTFNPWKWFSFSSLTGSLDYGINPLNEYGNYTVPGDPISYNPDNLIPVYQRSKDAAAVEQNAYSILQFEVMPNERFYFSIFDAVVWTKRWELDYIFPFQSNFFGQEVVGDYDNVMIGGTAALLAPGYGQAWVSAYVDEMDLLSDQFFRRDRNMYAFQLGTAVSIPSLSLGKVNLQYTKIEPYVYTHPPVDAPGFLGDVNGDGSEYDMQTYYLNNGEPLGFYQPPNSDEIRLDFSMRPHPTVSTAFRYSMIRHGSTFGPDRVDGSSYYDYIDYYEYGGSCATWQEDPLYNKNFLRDDAYEWQHVFGVGAGWDGALGLIPFRLSLEYDLVFSYFSNFTVTGNFYPYEDSYYKTSVNNIMTLLVSFYP
ncbi:MAG: hypothetical protein RQ801_11170 [Spirochaetaceae bacterium]|nr:hypothetical protein [Spirochaetaceae bacterium]